MKTLNARDRLKRLLEVIPRIADSEWHSLDELRQAYGGNIDELLADLRALATRDDAPAGFVDGVQIFLRADAIAIRSSHFLRPIRLTPSEAAALELGMALISAERPPDERAGIARVRERLRAALSAPTPGTARAAKESRVEVHADVAASGDPAVIGTLRKALRQGTVAEISYQHGKSETSERRRVHPYSLVAHRGKWMLWGWCERSADRRMFRVDRITEAKQTKDSFAAPADAAELPPLSDGRLFASATGRTLSVRYSAKIARWILEREHDIPAGGGTGESESATLDYPLGDDRWAVRHVLQYGPDAEVVGPVEVRELVATTLRDICAGLPASAKRTRGATARNRKRR